MSHLKVMEPLQLPALRDLRSTWCAWIPSTLICSNRKVGSPRDLPSFFFETDTSWMLWGWKEIHALWWALGFHVLPVITTESTPEENLHPLMASTLAHAQRIKTLDPFATPPFHGKKVCCSEEIHKYINRSMISTTLFLLSCRECLAFNFHSSCVVFCWPFSCYLYPSSCAQFHKIASTLMRLNFSFRCKFSLATSVPLWNSFSMHGFTTCSGRLRFLPWNDAAVNELPRTKQMNSTKEMRLREIVVLIFPERFMKV